MRPRRRFAGVFAVVLLGALAAAGAARAGAPPNRLDKNLGFVVASPHLHNLFWDSGWNAHNQFSTASIDTFTSHLATNGYMNGLGQYGVGAATFSSATLANSACGASRAPNGLSTATLMAWAACELSNPFSGVPLPAPRLPVSNDLYVLYLPQNATIVDKYTIPQFSVLGHTFGPFTLAEIGTSCLDFGAEHVILPTVLGFVQLAIVPTRCAVQSGSFADITTGASHEIAEGAADAVPQGGWIDNSVPAAQRFMLGEAGDVCAQASGALVPTAPVSLNGFMFSPYWENSPGKCGVGAAVGKFRLTPRITTARRGSTATLTMTWIAPHRWRDLRTVELEVLDGTRLVGLGRFINDGSKTGRLGLGRGAGKPGAHRSLRGGPLTLRLSNSSVATSGPTGKTVTVHLALRFAPKLAKHVLTLELGATDRQGDREPFRPGGAIGIR